MAFRFNFSVPDGDDGETFTDAASTATPPSPPVPVAAATPIVEAQLVAVPRAVAPTAPASTTRVLHLSKTHSLKVMMGDVAVSSSSALGSIVATTDIAPRVYEGGLKVWECTMDLMQHLAEHAAAAYGGSGAVLELGCGQGLPGTLMLRMGRPVVFQDLNAEVLTLTTSPTVALNVDPDTAASRARFVAGDWASSSMDPLLARCRSDIESTGKDEAVDGFGLILTAETIYTAAANKLLCALLRKQLRWPDGVALVAAKRYYFGLGGGTIDFATEAATKGEGGRMLETKTIATFADGSSNIRELLHVCWKR